LGQLKNFTRNGHNILCAPIHLSKTLYLYLSVQPEHQKLH